MDKVQQNIDILEKGIANSFVSAPMKKKMEEQLAKLRLKQIKVPVPALKPESSTEDLKKRLKILQLMEKTNPKVKPRIKILQLMISKGESSESRRSKSAPSGKIKMKDIEILWSEGDQSKFDKFPKKYKTWKSANEALKPVARDNKGHGGYNKTKFVVTFVDGETYQGLLYVTDQVEDNPLITDNVVGKHIKDYLEYELSDRSQSTEETKKEISAWLSAYDLGVAMPKRVNKVSAQELVDKIVKWAKDNNVDPEYAHKTKYIKADDVEKMMSSGVYDELIMAFYCGIHAGFDWKVDGELQSDRKVQGIFVLMDDYVKPHIDRTVQMCQTGKFEIGLKYPSFDWDKILKGKHTEKIIEGKKYTSPIDGSETNTVYKIFIYPNIVIGGEIGKITSEKNSIIAETNVDRSLNPLKNSSYLGIASSDPKAIYNTLKNMAKQSNSYVKDIDVLDNGLGGVEAKDLDVNRVKYKDGGEVQGRMLNFLTEDLRKLEKAINENDNEEIEKFFSYWNQHLKSLETKTNDRMYNFLKDDLSKLKEAINENDNEEIEKFFSYWNQHLGSLKMAQGGSTYAGGGEIEMVHLSPENRLNGFTTDKAFKQGDIMVQRVGGSTSWSVAINGVAKGRVLDAYTKEQALRKAEKEYDGSTYAGGGETEELKPSVLEKDGTTYTSHIVEIGKTKYVVSVVEGNHNYVNVRKVTANPYGLTGKQFDNFEEAIAHYKNPSMKVELLKIQTGTKYKFAKGGETYSNVWYSLKERDKHWDETPQNYLEGTHTWKQAVAKVVELAKQKGASEVRLSTSKGYDNQGHYINPNYFSEGGQVWGVEARRTDSSYWEQLEDNLTQEEAERLAKKYKDSGDYHAVVAQIPLPFAEGGSVDEEVIEIFVNDYPYYLKKSGDSTHFNMANNKEGVNIVIPSHILQHRGTEYYEDVRSWLKGGASPDGKKYKDDSYEDGGEIPHKLHYITYYELPNGKWEIPTDNMNGIKYAIFNDEQSARDYIVKNKKNGETWMQDAEKEMEKEGTVGLFTRKSKEHGKSTVDFAKEVLSNPDKFSEKTRKEAQFMKNANPELFADGGEIKDISVNVHEDSFPFSNSKEKGVNFNSLKEAKEWAVSEFKKQRKHRANSGKLWASFIVNGKEVFEERISEEDELPKKLKGYRVDFYRSSDIGSNPANIVSNGQFNSMVLVTDGIQGDSFSVMSDEPYLKLETKEFMGNKQIYAKPINVDDKAWKMFGGTFVWSSDSRFRREVSEQPIQLHDRVEYAKGGEIKDFLPNHIATEVSNAKYNEELSRRGYNYVDFNYDGSFKSQQVFPTKSKAEKFISFVNENDKMEDGGEINYPEEFNTLYDKYNAKDYWFVQDRIKNQIRNWENAIADGDENAKKYTKQDIINVITNNNKARTYLHTYVPLEKAAKENDTSFLKDRVRYDQKFSKEAYEVITGKKLPNTNKAIAEVFSSNKFSDGGDTNENWGVEQYLESYSTEHGNPYAEAQKYNVEVFDESDEQDSHNEEIWGESIEAIHKDLAPLLKDQQAIVVTEYEYSKGGALNKRYGVFLAGKSIGEIAYAENINDLLDNKMLKRWSNWGVIKFKDDDGRTISVQRHYMDDDGMSAQEVIEDYHTYASLEDLEEDIEVLDPKNRQSFGKPRVVKGWKLYEDGGEVENPYRHTYMMLGRLQSDNDYFLRAGTGNEKHLWAGNVNKQIAEMKNLWNSLPEDGKPEWLSMEEILDYETKMKNFKN